MGAKNRVIAGDYLNKPIVSVLGACSISISFGKVLSIDKNNVESYEVVDEEKTKSAASAVGRGLAGSLLLGPVGLLAGLSAKTKGVHVVALEFKDGKKSLIEVDGKAYKNIVRLLF